MSYGKRKTLIAPRQIIFASVSVFSLVLPCTCIYCLFKLPLYDFFFILPQHHGFLFSSTNVFFVEVICLFNLGMLTINYRFPVDYEFNFN